VEFFFLFVQPLPSAFFACETVKSEFGLGCVRLA